MLTQEILKELVHYNPDTGIFTYLKQTNPRAVVGQIAGSVQRCGHLSMQYKKKQYQLHQLAFLYVLGYLPNEVDHINRISDDNRWENLRVCNRTQNSYNSSIRSDNTSGTKGISFNKATKKWRVRMYINGIPRQLGSYTDKDEAIRMNMEFRKLHHGEFAHA